MLPLVRCTGEGRTRIGSSSSFIPAVEDKEVSMSHVILSAMMIGVFAAIAAVPDEGHADQEAIASRPGSAHVVFVAHDYGYSGPDRIPAGITTVEIVNQGQDLHHAQIVKLAAGRTAEEFVSAMKSNPAHWPSW